MHINRIWLVLIVSLCTLVSQGAEPSCPTDLRVRNFNSGWKFSLGDTPEAKESTYDDSGWRALSLPHDWAIEGSFSLDNPSGTGGGALPGGIGWYRKSFRLPENLAGKRVFVDFDGAYMNASVFVNGTFLGTRPYGYASFSYDITGCLSAGGSENVIAVRIDNAEQPNSRWYSGCGIYRNVWLRIVDEVHIPKDGTFVTSEGSMLNIETNIENLSKRIGKCVL